MELAGQVFRVAPPLECLRGAPNLEALQGTHDLVRAECVLVGTIKLGWEAFTAWGAHSQICPPGDPPTLCGRFLVPGLADLWAVTEVGKVLQQLRRPR